MAEAGTLRPRLFSPAGQSVEPPTISLMQLCQSRSALPQVYCVNPLAPSVEYESPAKLEKVSPELPPTYAVKSVSPSWVRKTLVGMYVPENLKPTRSRVPILSTVFVGEAPVPSPGEVTPRPPPYRPR